MIGAIAGDIIGSVHEGTIAQTKDFPLFTDRSCFTDDTVLTIAVANATRTDRDYARCLRYWAHRYPDAGYGGMFREWLSAEDAKPYGSYGNGSAMRVSPVAWAFGDLHAVLAEAARSADVTHNHPEGVKGAQAVAAAVFLARTSHDKADIAALFYDRFRYPCMTLAEFRNAGGFDVTCQGTVPSAAAAFLESVDFEDAIRNAISLGGDADTLACITGAIAEAFYGGTPNHIQREVMRRLDRPLRGEVMTFSQAHGVPISAGPGDEA